MTATPFQEHEVSSTIDEDIATGTAVADALERSGDAEDTQRALALRRLVVLIVRGWKREE